MKETENKKKGSRWIVTILAAFLFFACVGLFFLFEIKDYTDKVPKITPKESVTIKAGQTLSAEDMFNIECKGSYETRLSIVETDISDAAVSADGKTLYVGSDSGSIRILIGATGEVAEHVDEENVIVVTMEK